MYKPLEELTREELIEVILKTGAEKYLKSSLNDASLEDLRNVASIVHVGKKGMTGFAKFFFFLGLVLLFMVVVSLIRAHWLQAGIELFIAIISLSLSSILHTRKNISRIQEETLR